MKHLCTASLVFLELGCKCPLSHTIWMTSCSTHRVDRTAWSLVSYLTCRRPPLSGLSLAADYMQISVLKFGISRRRLSSSLPLNDLYNSSRFCEHCPLIILNTDNRILKVIWAWSFRDAPDTSKHTEIIENWIFPTPQVPEISFWWLNKNNLTLKEPPFNFRVYEIRPRSSRHDGRVYLYQNLQTKNPYSNTYQRHQQHSMFLPNRQTSTLFETS